LGKFIDSQPEDEEIEVELNELFGEDNSKQIITRQTNNVARDAFNVVTSATLNVTTDNDFVAQIPPLEETFFFPESIITGKADFGENGIGLTSIWNLFIIFSFIS